MLPQNHDLDMTPNGVPIVVNVSQYDVGREINFYLYNGSEVYTPAVGALIRIEGTKPDNTGFSYNATYTGNKVTISITDQMTVLEGEVRCELRVTEGGSDVGSLNFILLVEKAALRSDIPISDTEIPAIIELARAEQYNAEAWAVGQRNGQDVPPTDPTYHNNAKYWSENAQHGSLDMLSDVEITTPSDGQALIYDADNDEWINGDVVDALDDLSDTNITTPANGDLLQYNSADDEWVNSSDVWDTTAIMGAKNAFPYNPSWLNARFNGTFSYSNGTYTINTNTTEYSGMYISHSNMQAHFGNYFKGSWILSFEYKGDASFTGLIGEVSHTVSEITTSFQKYTATISDITQIDDIYFYSRDTSASHTITVKNLMIRPVSDANDTFADYAPTNRECMTYAANAILGAHNHLQIVTTTQTVNYVTFTVNKDSEGNVLSIKANGTASAFTSIELNLNVKLKQGETYIISDGIERTGTTTYGVRIGDSSDSYAASTTYGTGIEDSFIADTKNTAKLIVQSGTVLSNVMFYPMIKVASDTYTGYEPYAMTNRELTEKVISGYKILATATANQTWASQLSTLYSTYNALSNADKLLTEIWRGTDGDGGVFHLDQRVDGIFTNNFVASDGSTTLIRCMRLSSSLYWQISIVPNGTVTPLNSSADTNSTALYLVKRSV